MSRIAHRTSTIGKIIRLYRASVALSDVAAPNSERQHMANHLMNEAAGLAVLCGLREPEIAHVSAGAIETPDGFEFSASAMDIFRAAADRLDQLKNNA